ncbi:microcin C ABC transporter permease YejB [Rickettsiales bacterium]|nr:microcin C ABC transporter permease YejB [Rickettsiales bacterium]
MNGDMIQYILKRLLLIFPTLLGIITINFIIIQAAPGGPVENLIAKITGTGVDSTARISNSGSDHSSAKQMQNNIASGVASKYRGAQGLDPEIIKEIEKIYGFDKPAHIRFWEMIKSYAQLDFGNSFFKDKSVVELILDKLPVSISLGLWTTLLVYLISIPLGIKKAVRDGSKFDIWSSAAIIIGVAIPSFLFAILLVVLFAGGSYWQIFPLRGLTSSNWDELSTLAKIADYFWHIALPVISMVIGGFASLTFLCKNSFIEEIRKQYVTTAYAKGLSEKQVLYGHVFRNALLIVIAGFPSALIGILFTSSLLIEVIFSLDGLGLLGFEAVMQRDYPIVFGTLFIYTFIGLILNIIGDITYTLVDPRIDFASREG